MQSIEFDLTPEDYVAYNAHFLATSALGRRQMWRSRIATTGLGVVVPGAILLGTTGDLAGVLVAVGVVGPIVWFWAPRAIRREILKHLRKSSPCLGTAGPHSLTIEDAGIRELSPWGSTFSHWGSIRTVDETASHIFIYFSPVQAYIVPKERVRDDLEGFLSDVRLKAAADRSLHELPKRC